MDWSPRRFPLVLLVCALVLALMPALASAKKKSGTTKGTHRSARASTGKPSARAGKKHVAKRATRGTPVRKAKPEHRLATIRDRLRAEAGVRVAPAKDADLPMVPIMVLPGDTHARLSEDLTGNFQSEAVLRSIEPELDPGEKIYVPRAVLSPALSDPAQEEVAFGEHYPSLYAVARELTAAEKSELPRVVRNLQRLNGILDPLKMQKGQTVFVPKSLLAVARWIKTDEEAPAEPETPAERKLAISKAYLATDLHGLERRTAHVPTRLREFVGEETSKASNRDRGNRIDLVVIHTTEHSGSTFENTAAYVQRKRLANYVVGPDGTAYEVVPEEYRAYGCGDSLWEGRYTVDLEAINIEVFANTAPGPYAGEISPVQYEGLRALLEDIRSRRTAIHEGRIVTHRMVALSYKTGTRSRKGDPYVFDWTKVGLPDNSEVIDQDVLLGRAKLCTDGRYTDRVTAGQTAAAAARTQHTL